MKKKVVCMVLGSLLTIMNFSGCGIGGFAEKEIVSSITEITEEKVPQAYQLEALKSDISLENILKRGVVNTNVFENEWSDVRFSTEHVTLLNEAQMVSVKENEIDGYVDAGVFHSLDGEIMKSAVTYDAFVQIGGEAKVILYYENMDYTCKNVYTSCDDYIDQLDRHFSAMDEKHESAKEDAVQIGNQIYEKYHMTGQKGTRDIYVRIKDQYVIGWVAFGDAKVYDEFLASIDS